MHRVIIIVCIVSVFIQGGDNKLILHLVVGAVATGKTGYGLSSHEQEQQEGHQERTVADGSGPVH